MSTKSFEANTVDEALAEAASSLGIDASDLQYEVDEKAADFWGLGSTVYVVTVTVPEAAPVVEEPEEVDVEPAPEEDEAPAVAEVAEPAPVAAEAPAPAAEEGVPSFFSYSDYEEPAAATETPAAPAVESTPEMADSPTPVAQTPRVDAPTSAPAEPAAPAEGADLTAEAINILDRIFSAMGFECAAEAKLDGETMQIAITGEDNQYLLEGRGRGLAALELILNHSFRAWPDRAHKRVRVDAGDFRSQRDEEIQDMAYQVAHRAKETGTEQQTSELNPYERRIVHLTLADDANVTTRSLGNGFLKAVNVIPAGGRQRRG